jgi:methylase of polypeptide subunit release factors
VISYGLVRRASWRLGGSRTLARWFFGVDFPRSPGQGYFDMTTPALVKVVGPRVRRESRVLDMGTGPFAVIGLALWRRCGCHVLATDVHPDIVRRARENVAANGAPIRVVEARFFEGIDEEFDCVTFNIPYVPTARLARPGDFRSDGGPEGTSVIEAFLDAMSASGRAASAYLGVNASFVPRPKVVPLVEKRGSLRLAEIVRPLVIPVDVYVVERRTATAGPA